MKEVNLSAESVGEEDALAVGSSVGEHRHLLGTADHSRESFLSSASPCLDKPSDRPIPEAIRIGCVIWDVLLLTRQIGQSEELV